MLEKTKDKKKLEAQRKSIEKQLNKLVMDSDARAEDGKG